jgi:hypothetical protein
VKDNKKRYFSVLEVKMITFINFLMFLSVIPSILTILWAFSAHAHATRRLGWVGRLWVVTSLIVIIWWSTVAAFMCMGQLEITITRPGIVEAIKPPLSYDYFLYRNEWNVSPEAFSVQARLQVPEPSLSSEGKPLPPASTHTAGINHPWSW